MNRLRATALLVGLCVCALAIQGAPSGAAELPANPEPAPGAVTEPATEAVVESATDSAAEALPAGAAPRSPVPLSPCMQAIQAVLDHEAARLAELETGQKAAVEESALLELQREIERVKEETELQILRVQADFARREGRLEQAAEIEAALAEMTAPRSAAPAAGAARQSSAASAAGAQR